MGFNTEYVFLRFEKKESFVFNFTKGVIDLLAFITLSYELSQLLQEEFDTENINLDLYGSVSIVLICANLGALRVILEDAL
mmetsp:Transcript_30329/g.26874  ORF Transcript_30329/g.26874 Transcript_30329/m.26874 type:complete len:81 (-) Transcript_30329:193-435(-)